MRAAICLALLLFSSCDNATRPPEKAQEPTKVETELLGVTANYKFAKEAHLSAWEDDYLRDHEDLIVSYLGNEIWRIRGSSWSELRDWNGPIADPAIGKDITGDGIPEAIFLNEEEGSHGPVIYYVFHLDQPLRVTILNGGDLGLYFKDLDGDGIYEVEGHDMAFMSWHAAPANSARPSVILRHQQGAYVLALDLMRKAPPDLNQLLGNATLLHADKMWQLAAPYDIPEKLIEVLTDLVYSGNAALARTFLDWAWLPNKAGKEAFAAEFFECRLRKSEYWPALAAMNGLSPDKPIGECPGTEEG
ncbi:MAG TPA: hypothetical protein VFS04_00635 [Alphaproteobacteria bacterium]|nr:hypothetical protein [Alphaproteobacteria bacterium]